MRWLVDGYNVIRRSPELSGRERSSLEEGRAALCRMLSEAARASGDRFIVVFDGAREGRTASGSRGVEVTFSSARETADGVLARLAAGGGAVVSNDREVRWAATRAGAIAVTTDEFLARLERGRLRGRSGDTGGEIAGGSVEEPEARRPKKGNPRRLPKRRRASARALGRLDRPRL